MNKIRQQSHVSTCLRIKIMNMYEERNWLYGINNFPVQSDKKVNAYISSAYTEQSASLSKNYKTIILKP